MFPTKILLAIDGSEEAVHAGRMAAALAGKTGSELHVVYAEPLPDPYMSEASIYYPEMREEMKKEADREASARLAAEVEKLGETVEVAGSHARVGRPVKGCILAGRAFPARLPYARAITLLDPRMLGFGPGARGDGGARRAACRCADAPYPRGIFACPRGAVGGRRPR